MLHRVRLLSAPAGLRYRNPAAGAPRFVRAISLGVAGLWLALAWLPVPAPAAEGRPTVVSINACTDVLLLTLADPEQILGITRFSLDARQSPVAREAARFRAVSGSAEEVLEDRPDLVLAGRFTKRATREFLRAHGLRLVELDAARSLAEAQRQITEVGALLGHPDRAAAANRAIDSALAAARRQIAGRAGTVLPLQRRGWVSGGGTLLSSLLEAIGLHSAGREVSRGLGRIVDLETIVALRPDYLLVSADGPAEDQGAALLHHPALASLYPPARRLVLADRQVSCGGPPLAAAIASLGNAVGRLAP